MGIGYAIAASNLIGAVSIVAGGG